MMDKRTGFAHMVKQVHDNHQASNAQHLANVQQGVSSEQQEMSTGQLFRSSFGRQGPIEPFETVVHERENTWDRALALGAVDDDAPKPPDAPALLPVVIPDAPATLPAQETRVRSEALFAEMEQRLQVTPERVDLPPDALLRRAFRELPGSQREAIAGLIEQQDFAGLPGFLSTSRGVSEDYLATLVSGALARRHADAARLQPGLTPQELLASVLKAAGG